MKNPVTIKLDIYNACRTNTGRARNNNNDHYNLPFLAHISGAKFDNLMADLQWCAENKEDDIAIEAIQHFAEALLSAYEIQSKTYIKTKKNEKI